MPLYIITKEDLVNYGFDENLLGLDGVKPQSITLWSNDDNYLEILRGYCQLSNTTYIQMETGVCFGLNIGCVTVWLTATEDGLVTSSSPIEDLENRINLFIPLLPVVDVYISDNHHNMDIADRQDLVTKYLSGNKTPLIPGMNARPAIDSVVGTERVKTYLDHWKQPSDFDVVAIDYSTAKASIFGYKGKLDLMLANLCTASLITNTGDTYINGQLIGFYLEPKIFNPTNIIELDRDSITIEENDVLVISTATTLKGRYMETGEDLAPLGVPAEPCKDKLYIWDNIDMPGIGFVTDDGEIKMFVER